MSLILECKKVKRTGFILAFLCGSILAASVPAANMAFRSEMYTNQNRPPVEILLTANWQMIAMLNLLIIVSGACIMYHTEYSDNALQKMRTLPLKESNLFWGKAFLMSIMCAAMLIIESVSVTFCAIHWFGQHDGLAPEILKNFSYSFLLMIPAILMALFIASACKNMWISLGISVICVFLATMLPTDNFVLSLFPFALPFRILAGSVQNTVQGFAVGAAVEIVSLAATETIFLKVRRSFE